jgi:chromate transporter
VGLTVWWIPWIALRLWLGADHVLPRVGLFFSQAAVVTFGGAYSVLSYVAQQAVESYHWLSADQMLDGLAMAETTPGPLIQVVQFVGFMAAYNSPHGLSPLWAAIAGAVLTTWVTFVPCFLWIFLGAPYVEILQRLEAVQASLAAITAAVVGVMLNLSLWFALHTFFGHVETRTLVGGLQLQLPEWSTLDPAALLLSAGTLLALTRTRIPLVAILFLAAAAGVAWKL